MKSILFAIVVLAVTVSRGDCGDCPNVSTVPNLNYTRFGGNWVSVYESSPPRLPCLHYNISSDAAGDLDILFLPYHVSAQGIRNDPSDVSKGFTMEIFQPDLNGANNQVIATDYDTWAVVFDCKEANATANTKLFYSVTFWSRTRTMSKATQANIKSILDTQGIKYDTLEEMYQPEELCDVADTLIGPALSLFMKFL